VLVAAAFATLAMVPFSLRWFGDYHVIVESLFFLLCFGFVAAMLMRALLIMRPLRPGNYSMDQGMFTYWKLLTVLYEFGRGALLPFTTVFLRPLVLSLFGARVGRNAALGGSVEDPALIRLGEGVVLGHNSLVAAHAISGGRIALGEVHIGRGATIGVNSVVLAGVEVGEDSVVAPGSVVPPNTKIPPRELWGGTPAKKIKDIPRHP
jgi:hypothetical protein